VNLEDGASVPWIRGTDAELVTAIYVMRVPGDRDQFHVGLYHRDYGPSSVLHFARDRDLRNELLEEVTPERGRGLVLLSLEDDDVQSLCALCRKSPAGM
jgi:hypothetical protein